MNVFFTNELLFLDCDVIRVSHFLTFPDCLFFNVISVTLPIALYGCETWVYQTEGRR